MSTRLKIVGFHDGLQLFCLWHRAGFQVYNCGLKRTRFVTDHDSRIACFARRVDFSVVPKAFIGLKHQRLIVSAIASAFQSCCRKETIKGTPWVSSRATTSVAVYTKSNENLVEMFEDEIHCALESDPPTEDPKPPGTIPWEIEDMLGNQAVILWKKHGDEDIKVEVMPGDVGDEEEEEDGDSDIASVEPHVYLTVTISKVEGPFLEFIRTGYAKEVSIGAMAFKHPQKNTADEGDRIPNDGPYFNLATSL